MRFEGEVRGPATLTGAKVNSQVQYQQGMVPIYIMHGTVYCEACDVNLVH